MPLSELERRLREWADEYAGSRYEWLGWPGMSPSGTLMQYQGRPPQGWHARITLDTAADEVEAAVQELAGPRVGGVRQAWVLRSWYWAPDDAMAHRLQKLRALGLPMSERGFRMALQGARFYVAGQLGVAMQSADHEDLRDA